jgi:hypothetical protein
VHTSNTHPGNDAQQRSQLWRQRRPPQRQQRAQRERAQLAGAGRLHRAGMLQPQRQKRCLHSMQCGVTGTSAGVLRQQLLKRGGIAQQQARQDGQRGRHHQRWLLQRTA